MVNNKMPDQIRPCHPGGGFRLLLPTGELPGRCPQVLLKIQISSQLLRCGKNFLLTYHHICGAAKFFPRLALGRTLNF